VTLLGTRGVLYHPETGPVTPAFIASLLADDPRVFVARTAGLLEWMCPKCHALNRGKVLTAVARIECIQPGCRITWGLGLAWSTGPPVDLRVVPPFNARIAQPRLVEQQSGTTFHNVNCDAAPEDGPAAIARASGVIEWCCPRCRFMNVGYGDWFTGAVRCDACLLGGCIAVRLLELGNARRRTPSDWIGLQSKEDRLHRDRRLRHARQLRVRKAKAMEMRT